MKTFTLLAVLAGLSISGDVTSKSLPNGLYGASPVANISGDRGSKEALSSGDASLTRWPAVGSTPSATTPEVSAEARQKPSGWVCGQNGCRPTAVAAPRSIPAAISTIRSFRTVRPFFARRTGRGLFRGWRI